MPDTTGWSARGLVFRWPGAARAAVNDVTVDIPGGRCTALLGPNGAGKSTLMRLLLGTLAPQSGSALFAGRRVTDWTRAEMARLIGVLPQEEGSSFPMSVRECVAMGRYPHLGPWQRERAADREAVDEALQLTDMTSFTDRPLQNLSGGERQRARLARALAQKPAAFALDEPTAALDVRHEMAIFELLRSLAAQGATVLLVTHNLNLAARYANRIVLMHEGGVAAAGTPHEVLQRETVEQVYGWPVRITNHPGPGPDTGTPQVIPLAGVVPGTVPQTPLSDSAETSNNDTCDD